MAFIDHLSDNYGAVVKFRSLFGVRDPLYRATFR